MKTLIKIISNLQEKMLLKIELDVYTLGKL